MSKMTKTIAALGVVAGLGVAALPLSSYAATQQVDVSANVLGSIAVSTDVDGESGAKGTLELGDVTPGSSVVMKDLAVTVSTNSTAGYTLTLRDTATDASLINTADSTQKIAADTTVQKGQTAWAVRGAADGSSALNDSDWVAVPASNATALTIKNKAAGALTDGAETTSVTFGVSVAEGAVTAGTYTSTVIFTATSK